jgi:hypothetical protein
MKTVCGQNGVSPFILIASILAIFFSRTTEKDSVVIGTTVLNRTTVKDKNTMGAFFNQVPFVIDVNPELSFTDFLNALGFQWMELLRHSSYPYVSLLKEYREAHKVKSRIFDLTLTFLNTAFHSEAIDFVTERHFIDEEVSSLCIGIDEIDNKGVYNVNYDFSREALSEKEIAILHESILSLLDQATQKPFEKISRLSMLSKEQEHTIIYEFNNSGMDYPSNESILHMFSAAGEREPGPNRSYL